jgi:hypothetical protein
MNHQDIITVLREPLLFTGTLPTTFFVERQGVPLENMDTFSCESRGDVIPPYMCLFLGRDEALARRWDVRKIVETAYTSIERQGDKEYFVAAFCAGCAQPPPVFSLYRIEIRRHGDKGNITLIDTGERSAQEHRLLMHFTTGIMTCALSLEEIVKQLAK